MLNRYISMDEFLMNRAKLEDLSDEMKANANITVPKINELLERFGHYRGCNSGLRLMEDHLALYKQKNDARAKQGLPPLHVPLSSKHLTCEAIDVEDHDGQLKIWVKNNIHVLEELGLWCEAFDSTPSWLHAQIVPPKSGSRVFNP